MGGQTSKGQNAVSHGVDESEQKIDHDRFRVFKFLEKEEEIQIAMEVQSQKHILAWENDLRAIKDFDHSTLLLEKKHEFQSKGFCGNVGSLKINYDNFPYLFQEEIDNRIEMKKHFEEEEVWYLLYCLVSSANDFAKINSKIGDVRPYNIFINEEGQIKIANILSWPYEKTNYDKTAFEKQKTYLSPEEVLAIAKGNHENPTNKFLSESFSIGLTLLHAGVLFDFANIYSVEKSEIDIGTLNKKLQEWMNLSFYSENSDSQQTYSPLLKNIVYALCQVNPEARESSGNIADALKVHENEILHLKSFDHKDVRLPKVKNLPTSNKVEYKNGAPPSINKNAAHTSSQGGYKVGSSQLRSQPIYINKELEQRGGYNSLQANPVNNLNAANNLNVVNTLNTVNTLNSNNLNGANTFNTGNYGVNYSGTGYNIPQIHPTTSTLISGNQHQSGIGNQHQSGLGNQYQSNGLNQTYQSNLVSQTYQYNAPNNQTYLSNLPIQTYQNNTAIVPQGYVPAQPQFILNKPSQETTQYNNYTLKETTQNNNYTLKDLFGKYASDNTPGQQGGAESNQAYNQSQTYNQAYNQGQTYNQNQESNPGQGYNQNYSEIYPKDFSGKYASSSGQAPSSTSHYSEANPKDFYSKYASNSGGIVGANLQSYSDNSQTGFNGQAYSGMTTEKLVPQSQFSSSLYGPLSTFSYQQQGGSIPSKAYDNRLEKEGDGQPSEILRKIDEQLQHSRKLFPS